jgi:hypothetical protein
LEEAFKVGIKYKPSSPLLQHSGKGWVFQLHSGLYGILARNIVEYYAHFKSDRVDKTYIPMYFYLGTGKSRHASEFAHSVETVVALYTERPLHYEVAERLKTPFVFSISFENSTPITDEEMKTPWSALRGYDGERDKNSGLLGQIGGLSLMARRLFCHHLPPADLLSSNPDWVD